MFVRSLAGLAGAVALFAGAQVAGASDVIPLKGTANGNASTVTLGSTNDANTELARYRGGYGGYRGGYGGYGSYRGGFYGGYSGYRGGFYAGYSSGYRGNYGNYHRPYYANYYRPYYYSSYYRPYYYPRAYYASYYYPTYSYPSYYYSDPYCYDYPVASAVTRYSQYSYTQPYLPSVTPYGTQQPVYGGYSNGINGHANGGQPVMPPVQPYNSTYPYDGGPNAPVPMPQKLETNPMKARPGGAVADLRFVSTTARQPQATQFSYPAYGEDTRASGFAIDRSAVKKTNR